MKKKNGKFVELSREKRTYPDAIGWRNYFYEGVFGKEGRKKITALIGRDFNYDFYDEAVYDEDVEVNTGDAVFYVYDESYNPRDIRNAIFSTLKILKAHQEEFPINYWFRWPGPLHEWGEARLDSGSIFLDGSLAHLYGDWDECCIYKDGVQEDIRNVARIKGKKAIRTYLKEEKKSIYIPDEDVVVEIDPCTSYQMFREPLEGMIKTCDFAIENGYYVVGTTG
ncbi:MAG: hypothetical protein QF366_02885 [Candidatus Poseidoniia archaeon]|nr:hypothetical protein [Candidatus Poseidoniia archaeon]MDP6658961.1 hypothetical protein [Candidatus Poseidoniia archaeon]MDP6846567.1 hypothetical protein [Candidatus Poseidoniia archaeon]MDP7006711.1 hypothetical protein [Candidatus Poseidoniia archaeon]